MYAHILKNGLTGSHWYKDASGKHIYNVANHTPDEIHEYAELSPKDIEKANSDLDRLTYDQWHKIPKYQKETISDYTLEGYIDVNHYLGRMVNQSDDQRDKAEEAIEDLDAVTKNMELPAPALLYRVTKLRNFRNAHPSIYEAVTELAKGNNTPDNVLKKLSPLKGISFTDPCFGSTSIDKEVAKNFVKSIAQSSIMFEIAAPKGTKGAWLGSRSEMPEESEFILPRGTTYQIIGVKKINDSVVIQVNLT